MGDPRGHRPTEDPDHHATFDAPDVTKFLPTRRTRSGGSRQRLEHLPGSALGFRNLTNRIAGSPLDTGGFRLRAP